MNIKALYLLGDIGLLNNNLYNVVSSINREIKKDEAIVLLGDNFYPHGVLNTNDEKWGVFNKIFNKIKNPIYSLLGNHDYLTNPRCQINNSNWIMDNYYYKKEYENVDLYFIDTVPFDTIYWATKEKIEHIHQDNIENIRKQQLEWLNSELSKNRSKKKIVFGHYPIITNGVYKYTLFPFYNYIIDIFKRNNVNIYISGHEHNVQYINKKYFNYDLNQIIIGSSSEHRSEVNYLEEESVFCKDMYDNNEIFYGKLIINKNNVVLQYKNKDNIVKYEYTINF